ncbi:MAG: hypothetical protein H6670_02245 [Anaerolineaceae bacterium]|nr:hypothetical protein [Anaerolineaceae bacterium]
MASRDRPKSENKKRNDHDLQEKRNEKRQRRREEKNALKKLQKNQRRRGKSLGTPSGDT